jgi:Phage tail protein
MFPDLVFNLLNTPETDLYEIRNIDGLGPIKANVNTSQLGSVDGESYAGSSVGARNIVLTIGMKPDWVEWSPEALRRQLDNYFMPKKRLGLVFDTMERPQTYIRGYVESAEPNIFSKDPETQVSIICPEEPYFREYDVHYVEGTTTDDPITIDYPGTVETGIRVDVGAFHDTAPFPGQIQIFSGGNLMTITKPGLLASNMGVGMSSLPGLKYVINQAHNLPGPPDASLLQYMTLSAGVWPKLIPGHQTFYVTTDAGKAFAWQLVYYPLYGSL